jgi:hypothetical protein
MSGSGNCTKPLTRQGMTFVPEFLPRTSTRIPSFAPRRKPASNKGSQI